MLTRVWVLIRDNSVVSLKFEVKQLPFYSAYSIVCDIVYTYMNMWTRVSVCNVQYINVCVHV